ncbi:unnamed protein product [Didymodactylos carnosus]|uniref:Uncharacterized protein n=1 Tax=Didymodactylos carnosus TaxID=1234261 RepID=A0A8S2D6G9_9BILA|nr:unnamed protein product [Didymodactylos carnosus]CAF3607918.1 unnamed protein product [Didymodactylos carnosus]
MPFLKDGVNDSERPLNGYSLDKHYNFDSDSDLEDFNYVLNETEKQLIKARQSLDKRKLNNSTATFYTNENNLKKYDEVLRTCETNIQCLQNILKNIHHSKILNSTQAIEKLNGMYLIERK